MTEPAVTPDPQQADWKATLPDDLKGNEALASFKDVGELAKNYLTAAEKAAAVVPVVLPESAEKYNFEPLTIAGVKMDKPSPEMVEDLKGIAGVAFKAKLTNEQAQVLVNWYAEDVSKTITEGKAAKEKLLAPLKAEWGAKYDEHLQEANLAASKLGGGELLSLLVESGLSVHPVVIKAFHKLLPLVSESGPGKGERHSSMAGGPTDLASIMYPST